MSTSKTSANAAKPKTKDLVTQIKQDAEIKQTNQAENEDNDWQKIDSEEEEDTQTKKRVVVAQGKIGTDKPKKLKDLFDDTPKPTQQRTIKAEGTKQTKPTPTGEFQKPSFSNSKGVQNKEGSAIKTETRSEKPAFSNSRGVQNKEGTAIRTETRSDKPAFSNSRGVQNKEGTAIRTETRSDKPAFSNSRGVQNQEPTYSLRNNNASDKLEAPKKYIGTFTRATDENSKVKAPSKDYLEAGSTTKYKEESQVEIEKPKFVSRNAEGSNEPHFQDIGKNDDLFLKKMKEGQAEIQNVYSEPKADREKTDRPDRPERTDRPKKPYVPREHKEKEDETKYDSDGFEIVATVKSKPADFQPKRRYFNEGDRKERGDKNFRGGKRGDRKPFQKRDRSAEKTETKKEENADETVEIKPEEVQGEQIAVPKEKKADKKTIAMDPNAKKLKDLFA